MHSWLFHIVDDNARFSLIELKRIVNLLSGYPDPNTSQISYMIVTSSNLYGTAQR